MECPYCGKDSRVLDSRGSANGREVRRRRECLACERRFTTYERIEPLAIRVQKRGGRALVPFDRDKILKVLLRVTRGRPVGTKACEDLVRGLETQLVDERANVIPSALVAERLLARLRELDTLAANRFATNYLQEDGSIRTADEAPSPQLAFPIVAPDEPTPGAAPAAATERRKKRKRAG